MITCITRRGGLCGGLVMREGVLVVNVSVGSVLRQIHDHLHYKKGGVVWEVGY